MIAEVWENETGYPFDTNYGVTVDRRRMPVSRELFMKDWLDKNKIVHHWAPLYGAVYFKQEKDRLLFVMRWS